MEERNSFMTFPNILTIVFIILKLSGRIDWSWIWVLSPMWIGTALAIIIGVIMLIVAEIIEHKYRKEKK